MKPLSGLDALFLHLETPATPMHVGALHRLQLPKSYRGDFAADVKRHVGRRLALSPVFTRRLAAMPLNFANPVWVRADAVDLDRHVRRIALPRPGTQRQLEAAVARLHAQCMPRDRPLWAFHVIEGLRTGELAFYSKVHHATLDGAAGVALAQALLDVSARPRKVGRVHAPIAESPSLAELIGTAVKASGSQAVRLLKQLPDLASAIAKLAGGGAAGFGRNLAFGPRTPFNGQIDAARSVATFSLPLARLKEVASAHDATLNEIVLTAIGGALRRYLAEHGGVPQKSLIAAVPVSLREAGNIEATTLATMTLTTLATHVADPLERLAEVRAGSNAAKAVTKQLKAVFPTDFPSLGLPWLLSAAAALYGQLGLANRIPPIANLVVSNVPGPSMPLYLAGARLASYWPLSIVTHGVGLNITLQSYAGSLDFGVVAARASLRDPQRLVRGLLDSFAELGAARTP